MSIVVYPSSLPAPILSGYSYSGLESNIDKTENSFGFQTQKQIGGQESEVYNCLLKLTDQQFALFELWYKDYLINGHKLFQISLKDGTGYTPRIVRMTPDKYTASMISNCVWQITFKLYTQEKNYISEAEYLALTT